jgi:hypothetical protein
MVLYLQRPRDSLPLTNEVGVVEVRFGFRSGVVFAPVLSGGLASAMSSSASDSLPQPELPSFELPSSSRRDLETIETEGVF